MLKRFTEQTEKAYELLTALEENDIAHKLKYRVERNTRNRIYFPYHKDLLGKVIPYIFTVPVHSWTNKDFYHSCACTRNLHGSLCPVCARIYDAKEIVNYKIDKELRTCGLTGDEFTKHIDTVTKEAYRGVKVNNAPSVHFVAFALLDCDSAGNVIIKDNKIQYRLQVARWSTTFMGRFLSELVDENTKEITDFSSIAGNEYSLHYPDVSTRMDMVRNCKVIPESKSEQAATQVLNEEIQQIFSDFDFKKAVVLGRPEFNWTHEKLTHEMSSLFQDWDYYKRQRETNDYAIYTES